jgi:iron complex outermembrane recepter protein
MMLKTMTVGTTIALILAGLSIPAHAMADSAKREIHIPSGDLAVALELLAKQSGSDLVFRPDHVQGLKTRGVDGQLSTEEAATRLLEGTSLILSIDSSGAMLIALPTSALPNEAPQASTTETDSSQTPTPATSVTPPQTSSTSLRSRLRLAQAGEIPNVEDPTQPKQRMELEEVLVTGSRLPQRDRGDHTTPVMVFDRQRIEELGVTNVADILSYVPQQPFSYSEGNPLGGSREVRLRGLGSGTTLVLIDGQRTVTAALQAARSYFDLNSIPLSAIERVEILSASASAVYGADAVGGVMNVILRKGATPPTVHLYYGSPDGGGAETRASLTAGFQPGRGKVTATLDYYERDYLLGAEREYYSNRDFRRFGGQDFRSTSTSPGNVTSNTAANLPGLPSRTASIPVTSGSQTLMPSDFLSTAGQTSLNSINRFESITPTSERIAGVLSAEFDLSDHATLFGDVLYSQRDETRRRLPTTISNAVVSAANPYNPFGVPVRVSYLFNELPIREDMTESQDLRATAGVRGRLGGTWSYEVTALGIRGDAELNSVNLGNSAAINAALASSNPATALNVFSAGRSGSEALLQSLLITEVGDYGAGAFQIGGFVSGQLFDMPGGSVETVLGVEARRETIDFNSSGIVFDAHRSTLSAFAEVRAPIVGERNAQPLLRALDATFAGRLDHYGDFGDTFNPQFGLRWQVAAPFSIRSSYSTSFRAAGLFEVYQPQTITQEDIADPRRGGVLTPISLLRAGNPNLEPETSRSFDAGVVLTPIPNRDLRFSATYWTLEQDARVVRTGSTAILAAESFFPERVVRDQPNATDILLGQPGAVRSLDATNINAGRLETAGVDAEISGSVESDAGRFHLSMSMTWVNRYKVQDFPTTPLAELVGVVRQGGASSVGTVPRVTAAGTVGWARNGYQLAVSGRYLAATDDTDLTGALTGREVSSTFLADLSGAIDVGQALGSSSGLASGLELRAGARNLFDKQPPFSTSNTTGYAQTLGDLRGRLLYASVTKRF